MNDKKKRVAVIATIALCTFALAACAGMDFGDIVQVDTPRDISQARNIDERMGLNSAEVEFERWMQSVKFDAEQWAKNIDDGRETAGILASITMSGLEVLGPAAAGVPYVGALLPAISGLAGVAVGKRRLKKEKEASYRAGLEELAKLAKIQAPEEGEKSGTIST